MGKTVTRPAKVVTVFLGKSCAGIGLASVAKSQPSGD
jgi:hypothetical protein